MADKKQSPRPIKKALTTAGRVKSSLKQSSKFTKNK
jgi:hypothetical protein